MTLAKNFITQEMPKEFEVSKADQIDLLNKSLSFFKEKDDFDIDDFTKEVMSETETIEKFRQYKKRCEDESGISVDNQFAISEAARKKISIIVSSCIILDGVFRQNRQGCRSYLSEMTSCKRNLLQNSQVNLQHGCCKLTKH